MVTVGVTPGDSSPTDTVRKDAGYPKVPVSQEGLDVVSVIPHSSVTHPYITAAVGIRFLGLLLSVLAVLRATRLLSLASDSLVTAGFLLRS